MTSLFSERFKSARLLNGLSLQDLADKLNNTISRQALHKYEKGEVIPDNEMLKKLCSVLNVNTDYFLKTTTVELGSIEFRMTSKSSVKEESQIIEQTKDYLTRYFELEEILKISSIFNNPIESFPIINNYNQIEEAAQELRNTWHLGCDPISNVIELLENNHIKVIEIEASNEIDGLQTIANCNIPVIAINKTKCYKEDRKRFTIIHELAHLLLKFGDLNYKQKEVLCHQFAGAVLFPKDAVFKELGIQRHRLMIQELGGLKQKYGISIQAIAMRAKDLGIISDNYCKQFFFVIKQMGWRIDEPIDYKGNDNLLRFDQLLFRALAENLITIEKAATLKNQDVNNFKAAYINIDNQINI